MPTENNINNEVGVLMWESGGKVEPVKVTKFFEIALDDPPECVNYIPNAWFRDGICGTFNMSSRAFKRFQRACYGWEAKGPLRIRVLRKLWKDVGTE